MTRAERVAAVLAEYREDMFRSEYQPEGRREYVVRSDIAQTVWQDMTRAVLAAQEGERGGAEVAADSMVTSLGTVHPRDDLCVPAGCAATEDWPFGAEQAARLIASVSWPNEREENRDGWAVRMLTDRADLLAIEAPRARARLESAIRAVRDHIEAQP